MQILVIQFEFSLLRVMIREVWDNTGAHNQREGYGSGSRLLGKDKIANIYWTARHSSSCFTWINPFIPSNNLWGRYSQNNRLLFSLYGRKTWATKWLNLWRVFKVKEKLVRLGVEGSVPRNWSSMWKGVRMKSLRDFRYSLNWHSCWEEVQGRGQRKRWEPEPLMASSSWWSCCMVYLNSDFLGERWSWRVWDIFRKVVTESDVPSFRLLYVVWLDWRKPERKWL